jgi:hypothetical protein
MSALDFMSMQHHPTLYVGFNIGIVWTVYWVMLEDIWSPVRDFSAFCREFWRHHLSNIVQFWTMLPLFERGFPYRSRYVQSSLILNDAGLVDLAFLRLNNTISAWPRKIKKFGFFLPFWPLDFSLIKVIVKNIKFEIELHRLKSGLMLFQRVVTVR